MLRHLSPTLFVAALSLGGMSFAGVVVTTPFRGVTDTHVSEVNGSASLDYHVVRVDCSDPAIHFATTPSNGPDVPGDTNRQSTRSFVQTIGAQVGINANYFDNGNPFGATTTLGGMAVSAGSVITPWSGFDEGLNLSATNVATIIERDYSDPQNLASLPSTTPYNVISGIYRLVRDGVKGLFSNEDPQPRTAAGVDAQGNLILLVVDGRNPGHSDGMTMQQLADTLFQYGAVNAFNLDGGGSSTLVFADGTARVVNVPVGLASLPGTERTNGNNLAIFAAPIPEPVAGTLICLLTLTLRSRRIRLAQPG